MEIIELGGRRAQEVYVELKQRLDRMGLLPDALFSLVKEWRGKKTIPQDTVVTCSVDYGSIEGVFLDIQLGWQKDGRFQTSPFITGKSLRDTGAGLDRMHQTAAAVTKAFRGDHRQYANLAQKDAASREDMVVTLSGAEQEIFLNALLDRRERLVGELDGTEQLLRRMVGSVTEYIDLAGAKPLRLTDRDSALLAIRDGNVAAFNALLPRLADQADELLIHAAGRAGRAGWKMTGSLLLNVGSFTNAAYLSASQKAVAIGDIERTKYLMENALDRMEKPYTLYYGEVLLCALRTDQSMMRELAEWSPRSWIESASPDLLYYAAIQPGSGQALADTLVKKGAPCGKRAWEILNLLIARKEAAGAACLLRDGMAVAPGDYNAFDVCVKGNAIDCAKRILDQGFDFEGYLEWEPVHALDHADESVLNQIEEHWQRLHPQERESAQKVAADNAPQLGGMTL